MYVDINGDEDEDEEDDDDDEDSDLDDDINEGEKIIDKGLYQMLENYIYYIISLEGIKINLKKVKDIKKEKKLILI